MTKQEEIEVEVDKILLYAHAPLIPSYTPIHIRKKILSYLHSQGVVIKVDKDLPYLKHWDWREKSHAKNVYYDLLLKAGYVAVEPLIKVDKDV